MKKFSSAGFFLSILLVAAITIGNTAINALSTKQVLQPKRNLQIGNWIEYGVTEALVKPEIVTTLPMLTIMYYKFALSNM